MVSSAEPGDGGAWAVFLTYEEGDYGIGSSILVTIHVFQDAEYADAPNMSFEVGDYGYRHISHTWVDTGLYTAQFTILEDDITTDELIFHCSVYDEWTLAYEEVYVETVYVNALVLDLIVLDPDDMNPSTGDTVEFLALLSYMGEPVDADPGWLVPLYNAYHNATHTHHEYLNATRLAKGTYTFNYTVPEIVGESGYHTIICNARYTNGTMVLGVTKEVELHVRPLDVWVQLVDRDEKGVTVKIFVVDGDGEAVSGANVSLRALLIASEWREDTVWVNGTTDGVGSLLVNLSSDQLYLDPSRIYVSGNVTMDGILHKVERRLRFSNPQREMGWDHDMIAKPLFEEPVQENTTLDLRFHTCAYSESNPLDNGTVLVYMLDKNKIYYVGNHTTDAQGNLTVRVTTPLLPDDGWTRTSMTTYFQALVDDEWMVWRDWVVVGEKHPFQHLRPFIDEEEVLSIDPMEEGRSVNISLDHPDADGDNETAWVYWGPGNPQMHEWWWHIPPPEWTLWDWTELRQDVNVAPCEWNGSAYVANITLPAFVPDNVTIDFASVIYFHDDEDGWRQVVAIVEDVMFERNLRPRVEMLAPVEGGTHNGTLLIHGTAWDDLEVVRVEIRIDNADWSQVSGTTSWSYELDTTQLASAQHIVEVRCTDGSWVSLIRAVNFTVDQVPIVTIDHPSDGQHVNGTWGIQGTASDDIGIESTDWRFDDDPWTTDPIPPGEWSEVWSVGFDSNNLSHGDHTFVIRCFDGIQFSEQASVTFFVNQLPTVNIVDHADGQTYVDVVVFKGTASDDVHVERVEVRIDFGDWFLVTGTENWTYSIDTKGLEEGEHIIDVWVFDDDGRPAIMTTTFVYKVSDDWESNSWPYLMIVVVGIVIVIAAVLIYRQRNQ